MNTGQKLLGLIATLLIAIVIPVYVSIEDEQQKILQDGYFTASVLSSTDLYAENCAICHGADGSGIGDFPALNTDTVRFMSESDLYKVISRGRDGTQMAGWASEEGGVFSNPQIDDFVTFVQQVNWTYVENRVADLGLTPPDLIQMEVSEEMLESLSSLPNGEALSGGIVIYAENCSACHGSSAAGTIIAPALDTEDLRNAPREETISLISGGVPGTLMSAWEKQLSEDEISKVVELIYNWPEVIQSGIEFPEVDLMSFQSTPDMIAAGGQLFEVACSSCHGSEAYGTRMAPALNNQIFLEEFPDAAIYQVIAGGVPGTLMPAWGSRLTDQDLQSLVAYLRSFAETAPVIIPPVIE